MSKPTDNLGMWAAIVLMGFVATIPVWMGIGKFQLCKYYFPEMNRMACFFAQLPAVTPRH